MNKIDGGIYTALVTPYKGGKINHGMVERLLKLNCTNGINRFYACGSSAEMPLLSVGERKVLPMLSLKHGD